jgi:hypothetical protein
METKIDLDQFINTCLNPKKSLFQISVTISNDKHHPMSLHPTHAKTSQFSLKKKKRQRNKKKTTI